MMPMPTCFVPGLRQALLSAAVILMLIGCDVGRYEIKEDKTGRTIRLDKWTGEITIIAGDRLVRVKTPSEQESERVLAQKFARPKNWDVIDIPQLGGTKATLVTSWLDNELHYQFTVSPITNQLTNARSLAWRASSRFRALIYDADNFKVLMVDLPLSRLDNTVDDKGKAINWQMIDSVPCTEEQYRRASSWNLSWVGFGPS
jgi:hypothetical protein